MRTRTQTGSTGSTWLAIVSLVAASLVLASARTGLGSFEDRDTAPDSEAAAIVEFKSDALVTRAEYTLGDIAEVHAADAELAQRLKGLVMGKSPRLGIRQPLTSRQIELQLERQGIGAPTVAFEFPRRMFVERLGQDVDMTQLRREIEKELLAQTPFDGDVVVERMMLPPAIRVPAGALAHTVEFRLPNRPVGSVAFVLDLLVDGESEKRISSVAQIDMEIDALRVEHSVRRGEQVVPGHCKATRMRLSDLRGVPVSPEDFATVLVARRDLKPGDWLVWSNVERFKLVRRGETVRLLLQSADGMRISTLGRSAGNGTLGDTVVVANASSGQRVQGIVVGRQLVQVPF
ncbi:flagellar basal body P-ring formation protein FlgA [Candidatus Sumerlaeota bacterium]|nr:flagellar basal body P-ring formation protein FlgA [Candidatus Sumerlaeota bacterium]